MNNSQLRALVFRLTWQQFAAAGRVDGLGGSEWRRALADWQAQGEPVPCEVWLAAWSFANNRAPSQGD
jgi:hypothetical protein